MSKPVSPLDPAALAVCPLPGTSWWKRVQFHVARRIALATCCRGRHWWRSVIIGADVHGRGGMRIAGERCRICGAYIVNRAKD